MDRYAKALMIIRRVMASVADRVVRGARMPVLLVRGDGEKGLAA